jgi:hypothetical protein
MEIRQTKKEVAEAYDAVARIYADKYRDKILLKPAVQEY